MTRQELLDIAKLANARFDKTREIQWKFNIAAWTLVVAGIYFFGGDKSRNPVPICAVWILTILFLATHTIFFYRTQISLASSKAVEDHIFKLLSNSNESEGFRIDIDEIASKAGISSRGISWLLFQILSTAILLAFFVLVSY